MKLLINTLSRRNKAILIYLLIGILPFIYNGCGNINSNQDFFDYPSINDSNPEPSSSTTLLKSSNFIDTSANNSLNEDDSLFEIVNLDDGSPALFTNKTYTNIHSHLMTNSQLGDMTFSGRVMFTSAGAGLGITFLSQFPNEDKYYRIRRYSSKPKFHLANHPHAATSLGCSGLSHELITQANVWYKFEIMTFVTDDATSFQISIWPEGDSKESYQPIACEDSSNQRIQSGVIGVWSMGQGEKYWADLKVELTPLSGPIRAPADTQPNPTPVEPTPTPVTPIPIVPTPTVNFSASATSITAGQSLNLSWSSQDADQCNGTGFNTGSKASGTVTISPSSSTTYTINCSNSEKSANKSVSVDVTQPQPTQPPTGGTLPAVTHNSRNLGWSAGTDISNKMNQVLSSLKSGGHLYLHARFKIKGNFTLPDGIAISAAKGGGFDVLDSGSNKSPLFNLGNRNILKNITMTHIGSPKTGYSGALPKRGVDYFDRRVISSRGKTDIQIIDSQFLGHVGMHFDLGNTKKLKIIGSLFDGGTYQVRLLGSTNDAIVKNSVFRKALIDGIKSTASGKYAPERALIQDSVFESSNRDGIDTAGGFRDSVVERVIFRHNKVSALDLKQIYTNVDSLSPHSRNTNIEIRDCVFWNTKDVLVITTLDRAGYITNANKDDLLVNNIRLRDSSIYASSGYKNARIALIKDGHSISWKNIKAYGNVKISRIFGPKGSSSIQGSRPDINPTNYNISQGALVQNNFVSPGSNYPFTFGPQ